MTHIIEGHPGHWTNTSGRRCRTVSPQYIVVAKTAQIEYDSGIPENRNNRQGTEKRNRPMREWTRDPVQQSPQDRVRKPFLQTRRKSETKNWRTTGKIYRWLQKNRNESL